MWWHTGSLFVAGLSYFQIVLTFPVSFTLYAVLFQFKFFPFLCMIGLFVILGIGADDARQAFARKALVSH